MKMTVQRMKKFQNDSSSPSLRMISIQISLLVLLSNVPMQYGFVSNNNNDSTRKITSKRNVQNIPFVVSSLFSSQSLSRKSSTSSSSSSQLYVLDNILGSDGQLYYDDEAERLEAERQRLLASIMEDKTKQQQQQQQQQGDTTSNTLASSLKKCAVASTGGGGAATAAAAMSPPPLTAVGRERLLMEMKLLESLKTSNDGVTELWKFWYNARGKVKTAALVMAGQLSNNHRPEDYQQAEFILKNLIEQEGIHWAEPINRLATLYYYQGRYHEAKELCELVLSIKPWHFGCQTGIVTVCEKLQDLDGIALWSSQRMPPLDDDEDNKKKQIFKKKKENDQAQDATSSLSPRVEWVNRMLREAEKLLVQGEENLKDSFNAWE